MGDVESERGFDSGRGLCGVRDGWCCEEGTHGVGFAGVSDGKGDCVAWYASFTEEDAGEE